LVLMARVQSGNWPSVSDAMRARMKEMRMSTAELARQTGLSETTIRYIGEPAGRHNKASLVAIAAVLRWRYDYLLNILRGEPEKNVRIAQPVSVIVERVFRDEIGPLKEQVSDLAEKLNAINSTKKRRACQRKVTALTRKCAPRSFARQAGAMSR
jgi:transcriptional regulator with XRE-family HTH domain